MTPSRSAVFDEARLDACADHVLRRIADAAIEDMRARYDLGCLLLALRNRDRRGGGARGLVLLAERLGVDPSALRRYAHVCETIPFPEFEALTRLRTERGATLTWSHVELLARAQGAARRQDLAREVANEGLSVRALSERVRGGS